jgi:hypothetical protein
MQQTVMGCSKAMKTLFALLLLLAVSHLALAQQSVSGPNDKQDINGVSPRENLTYKAKSKTKRNEINHDSSELNIWM